MKEKQTGVTLLIPLLYGDEASKDVIKGRLVIEMVVSLAFWCKNEMDIVNLANYLLFIRDTYSPEIDGDMDKALQRVSFDMFCWLNDGTPPWANTTEN